MFFLMSEPESATSATITSPTMMIKSTTAHVRRSLGFFSAASLIPFLWRPNANHTRKRTNLFAAMRWNFSLPSLAAISFCRRPKTTLAITSPYATPITIASGSPPATQYTCRSRSASTGVLAAARNIPSRPDPCIRKYPNSNVTGASASPSSSPIAMPRSARLRFTLKRMSNTIPPIVIRFHPGIMPTIRPNRHPTKICPGEAPPRTHLPNRRSHLRKNMGSLLPSKRGLH